MSRIPASALLTLSLALPGASLALGLGDIHVESTLRQPLIAQIELVDATHDDLASLSAAIPDQATFQRYGLERPTFLTTAALKVSQDKQGRPVLALRSTDAYAEPVITFLVELHSSNGQLIREYTVLLDPPGVGPESDSVESAAPTPTTAAVTPVSATPIASALTPAAPAESTPTVATPALAAPTIAATRKRAASGPGIQRDTGIELSGRTYTVARRDTLNRIAIIAGAHTRSARHRMMIAIFRANPAAFQANLNMLRTGATLQFPSDAQLSAISVDDANHEFASQMASWRAPDHRAVTAAVATAVIAKPAASAKANKELLGTDSIESRIAESAELAKRVRSLEESLGKLKQDLQQPVVQPAVPTAPTARAPNASVEPPSAPAAARARAHVVPTELAEPADEPAPIRHHLMPIGMLLGPLVACLALALATGTWIYLRRRSMDYRPARTPAEFESSIRRDIEATLPVKVAEPTPASDVLAFRPTTLNTSYLVEETKSEPQHAKAPEPATTNAVATPGDDDWLTAPARAGSSTPVDHEPTVKLPAAPPTHDAATTVVMTADVTADFTADVELRDDSVERELAFFNPEGVFNPESDTNATHVVIGGGLNEPAPFVERRKSPVDVLRQAIEREPERSDLRLKLIELYYAAAEQNRRAFLEVTRQLAKSEQLTTVQEWSQIVDMGRAIAPDDELFSGNIDDQAVA